MSTDAEEESIAAEDLERFDDGHGDGPPRTIEASVQGLWWYDPDRGEDGRMNVEVYYQPDDWVLYPSSLEDYLRRFEEVGMRPETAAAEIWEQLSNVLFSDDAAESLLVRIASSDADSYEIEIGDFEP